MSGNYRYGMTCYICGYFESGMRYLPHESSQFFCHKHSTQETLEWQCTPASDLVPSVPNDVKHVKHGPAGAVQDSRHDVLAIRCMEHRDIPPLNKNEASGAECPICAMQSMPPTPDPGCCVRCNAPRESTIHDTASRNTEIRMAAHHFIPPPAQSGKGSEER